MHEMQAMVKEFHETYGARVATKLEPLPDDRKALRLGLIREEVDELAEAMADDNLVEMYDALLDILYVSFGLLVEIGYEADPSVDDLATFRERTFQLSKIRKNFWLSTFKGRLGNLKGALAQDDVPHTVEVVVYIIADAISLSKELGLDPYPGFREVHSSNMSKLGEDGKPIISRGEELDGYPEGKVLKGPNYFKPDLAAVVTKQIEETL